MFYLLAHTFFSDLPGAQLFRYITFRAGMGALTSLLVSLLFARWFLPYIQRKSVIQAIREDGPKSHKKKEGTPTMGGVIILFSFFVSTLLWGRWDLPLVYLAVFTLLSFGFLGFLDDYRKVIEKNPRGVPPRVKLGVQIFLSLLVGIFLYMDPDYTTRFYVPFYKYPLFDLGVFYIFWISLIMVGSSNAVNLTDGLDGLAVGIVIMVITAFGLIAYFSGNVRVAQYLLIPYIPSSGEMAVLSAILVGGSIGFLWYNAYPAQIFMGDVGSLSLGAWIGFLAVVVKQELLLPLMGGIFVAEALSVILQVFFFKRYGRRIFRMAPLHHHFELSGWHEVKVVTRFWIVSFVLVVLGLITLKIR